MKQKQNETKPQSRKPRAGSVERENSLGQNPNYAKQVVLDILQRAAAGGSESTESTMKTLEEWLTTFPELRNLVTQHFDICARTEAVWLRRLAGGNQVAAEVMKQEIATLKAELTGEDTTVLGRILASSVAVTFMAQQVSAMTAAEKMSHAEMAAVDRRTESMQKQFFRAVEALALLREGTKVKAMEESSGFKNSATARQPSHPATPKRPRKTVKDSSRVTLPFKREGRAARMPRG